jgi:DNA-binding SARP family transcriptional activator/pimeloyl-ACP methyl ester carboxylesterase
VLVRVLGGVELVGGAGGAVPLRGRRQHALLAALTARANEVVATDRLAALLWEEDLPANPEAALHSAVFKLRGTLKRADDRELLQTHVGGYRLTLLPGDVDAHLFDALLHEARDQSAEKAAETLAQALELWRGPAYAGFSDSEVAQLEAIRLEEGRRTAVERLGEALVSCGRADEAVPLLRRFVAEHPLREAARAALMRALHRTGRTAEALDQYREYRDHIADELGLEPSNAMQALHLELLREPGAAPAPAQPRGLPGLQVRYLRCDGHRIAYGTTGAGPRVVVLLGWVSSLDVIASGRDPRSSALERLTGELELTLFDRAGTGLSPGPVADYGLAASVAEAEEVVRAAGPPVSLLAMSAAGPIAVALAARRPEWVSSLVLFGTFADAGATFTDRSLRAMVVEIARSHWGIGSKMLADLYRPGAGDEATWHLARVFRDSASAEVAARYLEATYEYDVTSLLPSVAAPALVLHYRADRLIPFRGAEQLVAGLPDATLVPLDGRVHLPDAADLDQIQDAVVEHVRAHAGAAAPGRRGRRSAGPP